MKLNLKKSKKVKGYSLVEILVAIGLFVLVISSVSVFSVDSFRATRNAQAKITASAYFQEMATALQLNTQESWSSIMQNTGNGVKHIVFANNSYSLTDGTVNKGGITLGIQINPVNRDSSGTIVQSGGAPDAHTRAITMTATWVDIIGATRNFSSVMYVNDWSTSRWTQTSQADFDAGTKTGVISTNTSGGELQLGSISYPDWCSPALTISGIDLPGNGVGTSVSAVPGHASISTGSNSSGYTFATVDVTDAQPPVGTVKGTFNGYKSNSIANDATYTYIATDTNSREVVILNTSVVPFAEIGYFDAPGSANGNSVYVVGDKGYVTTSDSKLYIFDLTNKSGSRTQLGQKTLMGEGSEVQVVGDFAYISLTGGSHVELQVVHIADPNNMYTVGTGNTSQSDASDLFVNSEGTRAYVGTASSSTEKEFIIFDTSNKPELKSQEFYQESGGNVSIEAENYHSKLDRAGKSWTVQTGGSPSGASGNKFMVAGPDTGTSMSADGYFDTSPELGYRVDFTSSGTYYFWVRAYANNSGNNNVHGGYDGANYPNVESINTTSYNSWRWFRGSIDISTAEKHWINIWMNDDGFRLDKIYLTKNSSYTPSGTGPSESTRTTNSFYMPELNRQIGDFDTSGMSIKGVTVVENNTRAIIVGSSGQEYQVLNISNETAPVKCGGLDINSGINGVASTQELDGDAYSYIVTNDNSSEFKMIRGGAGVGGSGSTFPSTGTFISQYFDTSSVSTMYSTIDWAHQVPANTAVKVQMRTGNTTTELNANSWTGPDGTASTWFLDPAGNNVPTSSQGKRYIQFKVELNSISGTATPVLQSININYQK